MRDYTRTKIFAVLDAAKDAGDSFAVGACRRLLEAQRRGWKRYHDPKDWELVCELDDVLRGRA